MKEQLIGIEDLQKMSPVFRGTRGKLFAKFILKLGGLHHANKVYDAGKVHTGSDIEDAMLDSIGIERKVYNIDVLKQLDGQPFITVSNHPYGHIDGIAMIGEVTKFRQDYKVMVNWILGMVDIMGDHFIGVNPYSSDTVKKANLQGVKECFAYIKEGHALGFFPAGAVSKNVGNGQVKDREWQEGVLKIIQKSKAPVIPVYVSGRNSWFFNFLDKVDWRLRTVRLCHELPNKRGKTMHIVFGQPIMPDVITDYEDIKELGKFLQEKTYELRNQLFTL